jgi:hypothetical protein
LADNIGRREEKGPLPGARMITTDENSEVRCYECGEGTHLLFECPDGLYVAYCSNCLEICDKLMHLKNDR